MSADYELDQSTMPSRTYMKALLSGKLPNAEPRFVSDKKMERVINEFNTLVKGPHAYVIDSSVYGENNIALLWGIAGKGSGWPKCPSHANGHEIRYYISLLDEMAHEYMTKLESLGESIPRERIVNHPNIINLCKAYDRMEYKFAYPSVVFSDDDLSMLATAGYGCFVPYYDEFVIRSNIERYMFVKLMEHRPNDRYLAVHIEEYSGNRVRWSKYAEGNIAFQFGKVRNLHNMSAETAYYDILSHEEIMQKHIDKMNWDQKKIRFWKDAFDVNDLSEHSIMTWSSEFEDHKVENSTIFTNKANYLRFKEIIAKLGINEIEHITDEKRIADLFHESEGDTLLEEYFMAMAMIGHSLIASDNFTEEKENNKYKYTFGNVTAVSEKRLRTRYVENGGLI